MTAATNLWNSRTVFFSMKRPVKRKRNLEWIILLESRTRGHFIFLGSDIARRSQPLYCVALVLKDYHLSSLLLRSEPLTFFHSLSLHFFSLSLLHVDFPTHGLMSARDAIQCSADRRVTKGSTRRTAHLGAKRATDPYGRRPMHTRAASTLCAAPALRIPRAAGCQTV